jgi:hypothetical protein
MEYSGPGTRIRPYAGRHGSNGAWCGLEGGPLYPGPGPCGWIGRSCRRGVARYPRRAYRADLAGASDPGLRPAGRRLHRSRLGRRVIVALRFPETQGGLGRLTLRVGLEIRIGGGSSDPSGYRGTKPEAIGGRDDRRASITGWQASPRSTPAPGLAPSPRLNPESCHSPRPGQGEMAIRLVPSRDSRPAPAALPTRRVDPYRCG